MEIKWDGEMAAKKRSWPEGPWQLEPDKVEWRDKETDYPCLIVRNPMGALCGYVGVPEYHSAYREDYDQVDVQAHGGLTFSDHCQKEDKKFGVCHAGPDKVWWLGFDTAHWGDLIPELINLRRETATELFYRDTYKDISFVKKQVKSLAKQLKQMEEVEE